ncbi:coiled-coil domain-containing protein 92 [Parasteatoda tepidariorum]|uniref:coiled-coil domain-containing protein 92 n=1 Tax=Parasteatoda tepidariorum TaxID=114398 RepID=UPI00077F8B6A|nr:coiled-coil domain-containing protein 92 [Parasteatoda tepidariorum]XP_015907272.1 coiled-coil domain-containing protein 92 [Parasteatoda tepidariorum]XP_015907273.1 coiled-coil domain-containing protein 92 [Parasteatoda tepidariorum]XP_015907274.1 coiled-coil domain-containing protein 92 [Parasteatoda tepidariorum]
MTQDVSSNCVLTKKCANGLLDTAEDGVPFCEDSCNEISIREQLLAAKQSITFLQNEHAILLKGLHEEIESLQNLCRDLQFRCEVIGCILPDNEFFKCSPKTLEQKVENLLKENTELRRKLNESHQAIDILDQKEKLALWQHHQELEQRDETILSLEKELEAKCNTITQLTSAQGARRKKGNFWRRFSFTSSNHPSTSTSVPHSKIHPPRVEHLSKEDLPSEMQGSLTSYESQYQSYSSYSSLSDKSVSDDEGLGHHTQGEYKKKLASKTTVKLPPITGLPTVSNRQLVRQQLRVHGYPNQVAADSLAIDQIQSPEMPLKRTNMT